jgi:hypothetical protein
MFTPTATCEGAGFIKPSANATVDKTIGFQKVIGLSS